jgi:hypothetical protein
MSQSNARENPPPGAERLISTEIQESVERFGDPALMAAGKVNIISLEVVRQRFAGRWELRKDQVFDFADRVLERGVGSQGAYLRVSDTDFFVVHPEIGRLAGQAACLRYLREVLNHFLGESRMAADGIMQVTRISKGRLEAAQVDAAQAEATLNRGEATEDEEPEVRQASPGPSATVIRAIGAAPDLTIDIEARANQWTPFLSGDGVMLKVSATLEPVYELRGFLRIGFRMIRRISLISTGEDLTPQQIGALSPGDLFRADMATITRGIGRLSAGSGGEKQASLIVPISFISLSSQRGRAQISAPLKEAGGLVKLGVICEILDIDGVPQGVLLAATSVVRPVSLLVVGRITSQNPRTIGGLAGAGLRALSFDSPQDLSDAEFMGWARAMIGEAKKIAKSVLVFRVSSLTRVAALASLGATHASLAPR